MDLKRDLTSTTNHVVGGSGGVVPRQRDPSKGFLQNFFSQVCVFHLSLVSPTRDPSSYNPHAGPTIHLEKSTSSTTLVAREANAARSFEMS